MKDKLIALITAIVDQPDKVIVEESEEEDMLNYMVTVAPEEMGKIIGKQGRVIRSIRNVMKIPAIKEGKRINISLTESTNPTA